MQIAKTQICQSIVSLIKNVMVDKSIVNYPR